MLKKLGVEGGYGDEFCRATTDVKNSRWSFGSPGTHVLPSGYGTASRLLHALARRFKTRPECTLGVVNAPGALTL